MWLWSIVWTTGFDWQHDRAHLSTDDWFRQALQLSNKIAIKKLIVRQPRMNESCSKVRATYQSLGLQSILFHSVTNRHHWLQVMANIFASWLSGKKRRKMLSLVGLKCKKFWNCRLLDYWSKYRRWIDNILQVSIMKMENDNKRALRTSSRWWRRCSTVLPKKYVNLTRQDPGRGRQNR